MVVFSVVFVVVIRYSHHVVTYVVAKGSYSIWGVENPEGEATEHTYEKAGASIDRWPSK
ncbi:hypothetical protein KIN20_010607 [Parelaphostrongylus tenuis]|uniref:Uncharacterized protein n=1 Tax=Parelaphostrongylus tenuis TaxID=148309 RepID=A0AAD5QP89_PARTN|nr:hypothetical protein KIN20_010607 [Parelaphostrongylus tenuis]